MLGLQDKDFDVYMLRYFDGDMLGLFYGDLLGDLRGDSLGSRDWDIDENILCLGCKMGFLMATHLYS